MGQRSPENHNRWTTTPSPGSTAMVVGGGSKIHPRDRPRQRGRSSARGILSTDFDESEMGALKNSKPNVGIIGPAWKGWHWPKKNCRLLEPMLIWQRRKQSRQRKHWVRQSRIFETRKTSRKRSLKVASLRIVSGMKMAVMWSESYTRTST
uniref:Uncharacterized protein LOC105034367 n=1 Tax=Elaeis guineensis var. tenera TaxID=51953 RepID=A0A6I9QE07_ELAGV|nr:uncharacterized protein LOC105034367 [Elaeis guineensis]